jgi:xylulokinase
MSGETNQEHTYLIGLDIGTSAVKGVLMSAKGSITSREKSETAYQRIDGGGVQFDVRQLYRLTVGVIRRLAGALPRGGSIVGLSIASASGNTVLVDEQGEPMIPAFSWMDQRVRDEMKTVFGKLNPDEVHETTGWPLLESFPLAHLAWLKCHAPKLLDASSIVCMSTDYLHFQLTGNWGIDRSTATTFYLQDQKSAQWHSLYLQKLGIPESKLPPIRSTGDMIGRITSEASADTGLVRGTPVVLGAFDHPCAARGSGILDEGQLLISCGTSWVGFMPIKERYRSVSLRMLTDPFLQPAGPWGAMFSLPAIATSVDAYIRKYISDGPDRYREFDRLAVSAGPGAGGLIIDPSAGEISDDLAQAEKAHIARAIMEGTVFLLKEKIDKLEADGTCFSSVTLVGGPSETFPWPQIVADVLGLDIRTVNGSCAGAVGAAMVAGIGVGLYADEQDALKQLVFPELIRKPDPSTATIYETRYRRFLNKYTTLGSDAK